MFSLGDLSFVFDSTEHFDSFKKLCFKEFIRNLQGLNKKWKVSY